MRISDWSSDVCSSDLAVRKVVVGANAIEALLTIPDGKPDAGMAKFLGGYNGAVDVRWDIRWSKVSAMLNLIAIAPSGTTSEETVNTLGTHIITPETETSRSEERRVGKECGSTGRTRGLPYPKKKNER